MSNRIGRDFINHPSLEGAPGNLPHSNHRISADIFDFNRLRFSERPDPRAPQCREMPTNPEPRPEIAS
jgi:hypothetical protein